MLTLQVQVARNRCVQPGSQGAGRRLQGKDSKLLHHAAYGHCTAAGWIPLKSHEEFERYIDSVHLIICHQLILSMLDTSCYFIKLLTQRHVKGLNCKKFLFKYMANILPPVQCKKKKYDFSRLGVSNLHIFPTKCHGNRWN